MMTKLQLIGVLNRIADAPAHDDSGDDCLTSSSEDKALMAVVSALPEDYGTPVPRWTFFYRHSPLTPWLLFPYRYQDKEAAQRSADNCEYDAGDFFVVELPEGMS